MIRLAIILFILAIYVAAIKLGLHGIETLNLILPT